MLCLALLLKLRDVCEPKDLRPIALTECTHKLYMPLIRSDLWSL